MARKMSIAMKFIIALLLILIITAICVVMFGFPEPIEMPI